VSLALYRTYRPGQLSDVIGQEHVTAPLARALDSGRAHHAYLFTGPRGCGKTSTARILARSLNCAQGPTSVPCGVCASCIDLAPNGSGSIDVLEMDAASHRGIDDARELREKAMYAPASSRYKVYIIDEAHQLTTDAANALLKLIEEPPPHLKFVFATTEPDKILATIRSRTHHYPYRLVSVRRLQEHLAWVCEQEGVPAEAEALALVAKAAAGSVRDALSILGQLVAGSGAEGVTYFDAVAQLGFTDSALLDTVVSSVAVADGPALFHVIDQVVEAGLDPRRFASDLLERLRDLVVLHEVPDAVSGGLIDVPDGQLAAMQQQVQMLGLAQLSRAADLVNSGLSQLKGATAPRLQLELLCARLLLPAVDDSHTGLLARVDQLEHRLQFASPVAAAAPAAVSPPVRPAAVAAAAAAVPLAVAVAEPAVEPELASVVEPAAPSRVEPQSETPARDLAPLPTAPAPAPAPVMPGRRSPAPAASAPVSATSAPPAPPRLSNVAPSTASALEPDAPDAPEGQPQPVEAQPVEAQPVVAQPVAAQPPPVSAVATSAREPAAFDLGLVIASWAVVLDVVKNTTRVGYTLLVDTIPVSQSGTTLVIAHPDSSRLEQLRARAGVMEMVREAVFNVLHLELDLDYVLDPGRATSTVAPAAEPQSLGDNNGSYIDTAMQQQPSARARAEALVASENAVPAADDLPSDDDEDVDDSGLTGLALIERELGGTIMTEYDNG